MVPQWWPALHGPRRDALRSGKSVTDPTDQADWRGEILTLKGTPVAEEQIDDPINVFGEPLEDCSRNPLTGFFRDGCCNTSKQDGGSHTVCVELTEKFLAFSRLRGNDLSTPRPEFGFPGLKPGDRWCLCAARWLEAQQNDAAPPVWLTRTHQKSLKIVPLKILRDFAVDLN